jgi:glycosyltransferase involved in cell wall biosynthesis
MANLTRKKTVCLAMIVKNEGHLIIDTLNHLSKFIHFDYWAINDNGSTDGTQDLIRNYFKEKGIPGELDETPWKDFAYNRTVAFNVAYKKTDYVFVWDADDEIAGDFKFPTDLTADSYKFIFGNEGGLRYSRCQLFNNHLKWHYVGVLHEYPACLEKSGPTFDVNGNYYFISGRKGDRSKDPNKYLKDAIILEKAFHEAYEKKDGIYNRYAFYTAQSYNSCGMHEKAIEFYNSQKRNFGK